MMRLISKRQLFRRSNVSRCFSSATNDGSVASFIQEMTRRNIPRAYLVHNSEQIVASDEGLLQPLKSFLEEDTVNYDSHEGIFMEAYEDIALFGAFIWKTQRGQAAGGVRLRDDYSINDFLTDGMRLSIGMGRKNALAGLFWGGGKGVIAKADNRSLSPEKRAHMMQKYGAFVSSLQGAYVAAEDSGLFVSDMDEMFKFSRHITCISPKLGGSGNPSIPTALGVVEAMEGALSALKLGTLEGKSVGLQGCGNVGGPLVRFLLDKGVERVVGSEINPDRIKSVMEHCSNDPRVTISAEDALFEDVDIVSPCAYGGVLNEDTVPKIKAKIIAGAANNQLLDPAKDYGMTDRGIIYCPDFVINRMGIVNCANESFGRIGTSNLDDPLINCHFDRSQRLGIFNMTKEIVLESLKFNRATNEIAEIIADDKALEENPIVGHRTQKIIASLVKNRWDLDQ